MKVIWINHRDPKNPKSGGVERAIYEISESLIAHGFEVEVISCSFRGAPKEEWMEDVRIARWGNNLTAHLRVFFRINEFAKNSLIIESLGHVVPWFLDRFTSVRGVAFFFHLHRRTLSGQVTPILRAILSFTERLYPLIYPRWKFITESRQSQTDLISLGIPSERILRIPLGVNLDLFRIGPKTKDPSLVFFGRLIDYKRPEEAVYTALSLAKDYQGLKLKIIGDGPAYSRLKRLISKFAAQDTIELLGHVEDERLSEILSQSWVNIHCSKSEGWGLSILEASASGTPTVGYRVPGVSETIEDGLNGITINDGDRAQLIRSVADILNQHERWITSSRKVAEKYSWNLIGEEWLRILNTL